MNNAAQKKADYDKAYQQTPKGKAAHAKYHASEKGRTAHMRYQRSEKGKAAIQNQANKDIVIGERATNKSKRYTQDQIDFILSSKIGDTYYSDTEIAKLLHRTREGIVSTRIYYLGKKY